MAFNQGREKENANPTILLVNKERSHASFGWSQIGSFVEKSDSNWAPRSATDSAIAKALFDTSRATGGKNVALLENAGLSISSSVSEALSFPNFHFSQGESETENTEKQFTRDQINAEEVFDIIRSIQDPEHPNTLEELGVVSVEQVEVTDEDQSDVTSTPRLKSVVSVRFT